MHADSENRNSCFRMEWKIIKYTFIRKEIQKSVYIRTKVYSANERLFQIFQTHPLGSDEKNL